MDLLASLQNKKNFSNNEGMIADYMLAHKEEVLKMSVRELSEKTFTSTSTIIRLCQKLGLEGFKEFKISFSRCLEASYQTIHDIDVNMPFHSTDSFIEISSKIAQLNKETITNCQMFLDEKLLEKAVDMILSAQHIMAVAVSNSFIRAQDFQQRMLKIGYYVELVYFQPDQVFLATNATQKDVVLLISYSGTTAEIENEAKVLKKRKIPFILISSNKNCFAAQYADLLLLLPDAENNIQTLSTFSSQTAIAYVLNVLYACIFRVHYYRNINTRRIGKKSYLHF